MLAEQFQNIMQLYEINTKTHKFYKNLEFTRTFYKSRSKIFF